MAQFGMPKSKKFLISSANLLLGEQANVFNLNPTDNSIGLVKNVTLQVQTQTTDLTAGFPGIVVDDAVTSATVTGTAESYEYTAQNLMYAAGLDGSSTTSATASTTTSAAITGSTTAVDSFSVTSADDLSAGDGIIIVDPDDATNLICRTITSISDTTITVNNSLAVDIASGATVYQANALLIGAPHLTDLAMQIVGETRDGGHIVIYAPRVKITQGFNLQFGAENYNNQGLNFSLNALASSSDLYSSFVDDDGFACPMLIYSHEVS